MIDREIQRTVNYTGMLGNRIQDAAVTESMGPIYDRTKEHLGTSDLAIIFFRKQLIRMALDLAKGIEHPMLSDPTLFRARPVDIVTDIDSMDPIWNNDRKAHLAETLPLIEVSTV
jgi:phthalate 4,5-dioxygenase